MARPSIDGIQFDGWHGELVLPERASELITRPGVDGHVVLFDAWRSPPVEIETVLQVTTGGEQAYLTRFKKSEGNAVYAIDPLGTRWTVVVRSVTSHRMQMVGGKSLIRSTWSLVPESWDPQ